ADYAVFRAIETDTRAIYTTPLKALSNQKYRDYVRLHGEGWVGLVTGENTINPAAPVVVMTTEILRNLIYEDPQRLARVRYVILDEIHYIADFPRGAVWEEIIIGAPPPPRRGETPGPRVHAVNLFHLLAPRMPGSPGPLRRTRPGPDHSRGERGDRPNRDGAARPGRGPGRGRALPAAAGRGSPAP